MRLTLGDTTYDLATHPLVIRDLDDGHAAHLVDDPPPGALAACARAGAAVVVRVAGYPDLAARREALVTRVREAEAAGVAPGQIVVDPGLDEAPALLGQTRRFAELGYPVLVRASGAAEIALAVTGGARLIQTPDVRTAQRVCDVIAAIMEARP